MTREEQLVASITTNHEKLCRIVGKNIKPREEVLAMTKSCYQEPMTNEIAYPAYFDYLEQAKRGTLSPISLDKDYTVDITPTIRTLINYYNFLLSETKEDIRTCYRNASAGDQYQKQYLRELLKAYENATGKTKIDHEMIKWYANRKIAGISAFTELKNSLGTDFSHDAEIMCGLVDSLTAKDRERTLITPYLHPGRVEATILNGKLRVYNREVMSIGRTKNTNLSLRDGITGFMIFNPSRTEYNNLPAWRLLANQGYDLLIMNYGSIYDADVSQKEKDVKVLAKTLNTKAQTNFNSILNTYSTEIYIPGHKKR